MSQASHQPASQTVGGWRAGLCAAVVAAALGAGCASREPGPAAAPTASGGMAAPVRPPAAAQPAAGSTASAPAPTGAAEAPALPPGVAARPAGGSVSAAPSQPLPPPAPLIAPGDLPPGIPGNAGGPPFDAGGALTLEAGLYRCELDRRVIVRRVAADGRSLVLNWRGRDSVLHAVQARTGALRFENPDNGHVWLVIVGKSMLLDARAGRTLANECRL